MHKRTSLNIATLLTIATALPTSAEVISITADLRSFVQSSINGVEDSFDEAIEIFDENGPTLPISTRANLDSRTEDDTVQSEALAISDFDDPTGSATRNPQEIGAEANCFSLDTTSYTLETTVVERRTIEFSEAELNFPPDGMDMVQSAIFPSGVIGIWSLDERSDLTDLSGELIFTVNRIDLDGDGNDTGSTQLVAQRVILQGNGANVTLEQTEGITVIAGGLDILPTDDTGGLDVDLEAIATAQVAVIPAQQINYEYEAVAGERFILEAVVTINASNIAGGTGVTAVVGRPFDNAAEIIDIGIPSATARRLQSRMNLALSEFALDQEPPTTVETPFGFCGATGMEMAGLFVIIGGWRVVRRRK